MSMDKGLGRGLDALMGTSNALTSETNNKIKTNLIKVNEFQPRKKWDEDKLNELIESVKIHGVVQPIIVRPIQDSRSYQIVAGERRWRAAIAAGLDEIPAIVNKLTDSQVLAIALIENLHRDDLKPVEFAKSLKRLITEYQLTQEEVAKEVGKSRAAIANSLRLLKLPAAVQDGLEDGLISTGHAKALLSLEDEVLIIKFYEKIIKEKLNVRQTESLVKKTKSEPKEKISKSVNLNPDFLSRHFQGSKIKFSQRGNEAKGSIVISYTSSGDFELLKEKFKGLE